MFPNSLNILKINYLDSNKILSLSNMMMISKFVLNRILILVKLILVGIRQILGR